ncbi:MAG TPA: hypothetical protein VFR47_05760 [Anaerolineales bacterium]|nr:hypothetical protein [Anaerolineales bacterium]
MSESEALLFNLTVSSLESTDEDLDHMARQLLLELKDLDVESAHLASGGSAPGGTKGVDPITAGTIALAVLPTMLPKVLEFLQAWSLRDRDRTIKFKGKLADQQIEFEGSFGEMQELVEMLEKKQKKKRK